MGTEFEWDPVKNLANEKKHGISFREAQTVFWDEDARLIADPDHSEGEERFLILGRSVTLKILVVAHCYREDDAVVRIISARRATESEHHEYTRHLQ